MELLVKGFDADGGLAHRGDGPVVLALHQQLDGFVNQFLVQGVVVGADGNYPGLILRLGKKIALVEIQTLHTHGQKLVRVLDRPAGA